MFARLAVFVGDCGMNHSEVMSTFASLNERMGRMEQSLSKLVLAKFMRDDEAEKTDKELPTDKEKKQADLTNKERFDKMSAEVQVLNQQCLDTLSKSEPKAAPAPDAQVSRGALMAERAIKYQKSNPGVSLNDAHRATTGVGI